MITSWLFVAAAVLGQVQTTQPAEEPAGRAPVFRVVPPATQPVVEEAPAVQVITPDFPTTLPEGEFAGLTGPVSIQVTETGIVITAQDPQDIEYLRGLIEMMDRQPEMRFQFFPLEHATARDLAQSLQELWTRAMTGVTGRVHPDDRLSVIAEPRANVLMVAATPENMPQVAAIVEQLDQPAIGRDLIQFVQIPLVHIKANEAQQKLTDMLRTLQEQRQLPRALYNINADVRTNSLLVAAPAADLEQIRHLVELIDIPPTLEGGGVARVAIFPLSKAVASQMATALNEMLQADTPAAQALEEQIRRLRVTLHAKDGERELPELDLEKPINIIAEEGTNSIVVQSTEQNLAAIGEIIGVLDTVPLADEMMVKMFPLKFADAETLLNNLQQMFSQGANLPAEPGRALPARIPPGLPGAALAYNIAMSADPRTNTLIVAGRPEQVYLATQIITGVDVAEQANRFPPRLIALTQASVQRMQAAVDEWVQFREQLAERLSPTERARERILVIPDERTNSLVVIANDENFQEVQQLVSRLDEAETRADVRFIAVENADVVNVADRLETMFEGIRQGVGDAADQYQLEIIPNPRTNTLIVSGSRVATDRARELVGMLDQPGDVATYQTKIYPLQQASAVRLAPVVEDLFEGRTTAEQTGPRTPTLVIPDAASNSLIVSASREEHADLERLLKQLDQPTQLAQQMEVIPLSRAQATQVADTLEDLVQAQEAQADTAFSVIADERTNSLVVFAPPDLMATVQDVVRRLDRAEPGTVMAMRVFRLDNAIAENLAQLLNEFFEEAGAGTPDQVRQLIIRFFPVTEEGRPIIDPNTGQRVIQTLVHQNITIDADPYTNSVLVLAPADHIDMMEMLIRMLDSIEPRTARIEAYQLRNADAEEMVDLLENLFQPTDEEGRTLVISGPGAPAAGVIGAPGEGMAATEIPIAFAVDRRTNTLIAAGSPAQLRIVESLVYRLDDEPIDERVVRVVPLQYANSDDVATTLTSFFESESRLLEQAEEGAAAMRLLQRQVTIESGGETTNMLLLSYSPRLESQIVTMISELDRPPPQVMIQVLMAEVTLDDRFEMGMEFALQDLLFSEYAYLGGNGVIKGSGHDFIGGTDLGAAGSGLGGVSFTVTSEDFNFLVRALQVDGRLEVLSRPALLVQDNEEANIKVGERVPVVTQIAVSGVGTVTPSVTYEDVGVNLEVTPIINPDGFVNMEIAPEISALGVSSVSIGGGVTLPVFTQRRAETSVTVKDGESIIIGGLITSRASETENKVPVLGDIPLVGLAFRSTVRQDSKTELLMVLTPHVVRNPEEARTISVRMRDQTGLMDEVRKNPLMQGLQVQPEDDQIGPIEVVPAPPPRYPDELGPELEEFGPPTTSIEFGPDRAAVAVRN